MIIMIIVKSYPSEPVTQLLTTFSSNSPPLSGSIIVQLFNKNHCTTIVFVALVVRY